MVQAVRFTIWKNQQYMDQKNEIDFRSKINDLISKHFSFLLQEGYVVETVIEPSKVFILWISVKYTNEQIKREVSINYMEGKVNKEVKYSFTVTITRLPYVSVYEDFFSLNEYLSENGLKMESVFSDFDEKVFAKTLEQLAEAVKNYAHKLVSGKEWITGYYSKW